MRKVTRREFVRLTGATCLGLAIAARRSRVEGAQSPPVFETWRNAADRLQRLTPILTRHRVTYERIAPSLGPIEGVMCFAAAGPALARLDVDFPGHVCRYTFKRGAYPDVFRPDDARPLPPGIAGEECVLASTPFIPQGELRGRVAPAPAPAFPFPLLLSRFGGRKIAAKTTPSGTRKLCVKGGDEWIALRPDGLRPSAARLVEDGIKVKWTWRFKQWREEEETPFARRCEIEGEARRDDEAPHAQPMPATWRFCIHIETTNIKLKAEIDPVFCTNLEIELPL